MPVINLVLMGLAVFLVAVSVSSYMDSGQFDFETDSDSWDEKETRVPGLLVQAADPARFRNVSSQNLFNSDRQDWEAEVLEDDAKESGKEKEEPFLAKRIEELTLFGVARIGGEKQALVNDPEKEKQTRGHRYLLKGDMILGCLVTEVSNDGLILNCQGNEIVKTIQNRKPNEGVVIRRASDPASPENRFVNEGERADGATAAAQEYDGKTDKPEIFKAAESLTEAMNAEGEKTSNGMGAMKSLLDLLKSLEQKQ